MSDIADLAINLTKENAPVFIRFGLIDPYVFNELPPEKIFDDYVIASLKILYPFPDFPGILQTFFWQEHDVAPRFPVMSKFLDHWLNKLESPFQEATLASTPLLGRVDLRHVDSQYRIQ